MRTKRLESLVHLFRFAVVSGTGLTLVMTVGAKKLDRYMLPALMVADLIARPE